tara:strand:+ start:1637 stop:2794 length:1158 start_codon:yes stop_codon:yes gene_type:complete
MPRNRVIYQSEGLYVGKDASLGAAKDHEQLNRVQSANYSFTINRQDVNQFGDLARIDSLVLDPPTVNLDFSYYLTDGFNERALGFFVQNSGASTKTQRGVLAGTDTSGNFASGHLTSNSGVNFFIVTSPDGEDLNKDTPAALNGLDSSIGVGNCYISDYSVDLSVGSLPTVNVTVEGANMRSVAGQIATGSPAVNQENGEPLTTEIQLPNPSKNGLIESEGGSITALRPGDVTLDLDDVDGESLIKLDNTDGAHIQSASISLPLSRSPIDRLGSRFPFAREVDFPVNATMNISAIVANSKAASLADILNSGVQEATITIKDHNTTQRDAIKYTMKGLKIDSQSFSSSIGSNKTVDITFSTQIGGPNDAINGVFMSGAGFNPVFQA